MSSPDLKTWLASPIALFALMLLASFANGMKQISVVKQTGQPMDLATYWSYFPETITALSTNVLAFVLLLLTDQLNFASAIAVGYGANSVADLIPKGRSFALKQTPDDPNKVNKP